MIKTSVRFALTDDTPYHVLTGELLGIFRELYEENEGDISRHLWVKTFYV